MMRRVESGPYVAVCQPWVESERGWGRSPDGFMLHLDSAVRDRFVQAYWDRQPDRINGRAPDYYLAPDGEPYLVAVSAAVITALQESTDGTLKFSRDVEMPSHRA